MDNQKPVAEGSFAEGTQKHDAVFTMPTTGRYLCLQALNARDGRKLASVAELEALDATGQLLPRTNWKLLWIDSEQQGKEGENALDGQSSSQWEAHSGAAFPHAIVIDLGENSTVSGIRYLPSSDTKNPGHIKDYKVYLSDKPFGLIAP